MPVKLVGFWQHGEADQSSTMATKHRPRFLASPCLSPQKGGGRSSRAMGRSQLWFPTVAPDGSHLFRGASLCSSLVFILHTVVCWYRASYLPPQDCRGDIQSPTDSGDAKEETEFGERKYGCQKGNSGLAKPLTALWMKPLPDVNCFLCSFQLICNLTVDSRLL